ncbi:MAG: PadR family transcriptional regulator [Chloroflexota bacterium]
MYELIILKILIQRPAHGYLIAKIINKILGPFAKMSNGRLYPLLSKLEQDGLIIAYEEATDESEGGRHVRSYKITEAGGQRFHELMMDTTSNPGEYQKLFLQKVSAFDYLTPAERLRLIDHYLNYCQSHLLYLTTATEELGQNRAKSSDGPTYPDRIINTMQHLVEQWQLELNWAKKLHQRELAQSQNDTLIKL